LTLRSRLAALLPGLAPPFGPALFTLLRPTAEGAPSLQSHLTQTAARVACGRSAPPHDRQSRHLHADASWHTEGEARKMGAKPRGGGERARRKKNHLRQPDGLQSDLFPVNVGHPRNCLQN
jgi:hypothetical protein